eukprot:CAMPEP_0185007808 /NCGR_PEP_ID=MMETSP1098-20130426/88101_1 /TAXON_ID=89044 /ORGANISM="Spumella elongata, Strain CCAP 955/1" /LENGTH=88 /DNA_ID=CAMNT_0027536201 /DNA_START=27 /DNA_END=289 /DNA_ORIENTATION=+
MTLLSGLFTSSDFGVTWASSTGAPTSNYYNSIASSPSGQYVVAASATGGTNSIFLSQDYGVSYTRTLAPNTQYDSIVCSDSGVITVSA